MRQRRRRRGRQRRARTERELRTKKRASHDCTQVAVAEGRAGAVGGELHGQGGLLQRGDVGLRLEHALAARGG